MAGQTASSSQRIIVMCFQMYIADTRVCSLFMQTSYMCRLPTYSYRQRKTSRAAICAHALAFPRKYLRVKVCATAHIHTSLLMILQTMVDTHSSDTSAEPLHLKTHILSFAQRRVASPSTGRSRVFRRCRQPRPYTSINDDDHHHIF